MVGFPLDTWGFDYDMVIVMNDIVNNVGNENDNDIDNGDDVEREKNN